MSDFPTPSISLIIPCWRDGDFVRHLAALELDVLETIVVLAVADPLLAADLASRGVQTLAAGAPNRGEQLALGARQARGDVLLFHHADSELAPDQVEAVRTAMSDPLLVGGAFHRKFDARHPLFRWLEPLERWRATHTGALFGDQSLFVRRAHYEKIGGFRSLALMEDVEFSLRLRRSGPIVLLDPPMRSSARAHQAGGSWKTSLRNGLFLLLFRLGVSPARLHAWYYQFKRPV